MKLPRDLGGEEFARLLSRYGYKVVRQSGSHMRLVSSIKGRSIGSLSLNTSRCGLEP